MRQKESQDREEETENYLFKGVEEGVKRRRVGVCEAEEKPGPERERMEYVIIVRIL